VAVSAARARIREKASMRWVLRSLRWEEAEVEGFARVSSVFEVDEHGGTAKMKETNFYCDKCGGVIEGEENHNKNEKFGKLHKKMIPLLPWHVRITTEYWKGREFDLCDKCKKELLDSLKTPARTYDC
jgi:hypothetical protein